MGLSVILDADLDVADDVVDVAVVAEYCCSYSCCCCRYIFVSLLEILSFTAFRR